MTTNHHRSELLVSVIVPAFNAAEYLPVTLDSVLAQTCSALEVIVVDDGSADDTSAVARSVSDPRVRWLRQEHRGAAAARNRGLAAARGKFIQFLDADDLLATDKLERQLTALAAAPAGAVASGPWYRFNTDVRSAIIQTEPVWTVREPVEWLIASLCGNGMMQPGAWLTPREIIAAAGPWEESLSLHDDGEFFTRVLLKATGNIFVPGATVFYREVAGSLSRKRSRRAIESALAVCRSRHRHLLAVRDDPLARRAIATQYAQFAYEFAAAAPDLGRQALRAMRELRTAPAFVIGSPAFRWLSRVFGMRLALLTRHLLGGANAAAHPTKASDAPSSFGK